jgi:phosphate-selective porin OprO/OprP
MRYFPLRLFALCLLLLALGAIRLQAQEFQLQESAVTESTPDFVTMGAEPTSDPVELESRIKQLENAISLSDQKIAELEASKRELDAKKATFPNVTVNGVFQADGIAFNQTQASREVYGRIESGADFRRARLGARGAVSDSVDYFLQMDFGFFGRPTFTDVWADFKTDSALGTFRVGQWKQPFSLESVGSFRYTTFMERSSSFQAFVPFRRIGVGFYNHSLDENWTWAASYFRTGQDQYGSSLSTDRGNGGAGRLTHLLWYCEGGTEYLHLGTAYYLNAPPNSRARFRSTPEIYVGEFDLPAGGLIGTSGQTVPSVANGTPFVVDTGTLIETELIQTLGQELLWVQGPLSVQAEGYGAFVNSDSAGHGFLNGSYAQVGYFLTGEHRPYDRKAGAVDRVIPFSSWSRNSTGWGAWEIAARWSYLDITDGGIQGGELQDLTTGLNWYVNPYCKCVFNYIHSWAQSRPIRNGAIVGDTMIASQCDVFGVRCQLDF